MTAENISKQHKHFLEGVRGWVGVETERTRGIEIEEKYRNEFRAKKTRSLLGGDRCEIENS